MNSKKLQNFRNILLQQLRQHARLVSEEQARAIAAADDGAKESADLSLRDLIQEIELQLGERDSQMVADIDQALQRIDEGTYGQCLRCGKPIAKRRLEAIPTARFDARCQAEIEQAKGFSRAATL